MITHAAFSIWSWNKLQHHTYAADDNNWVLALFWCKFNHDFLAYGSVEYPTGYIFLIAYLPKHINNF